MTRIRPSFRAGSFYPSEAREVASIFEGWRGACETSPPERTFGGLVPHAGWVFSGRLAWRTLSCLRGPQRVILLGAVHVPGVPGPALGEWEAWETPLGEVRVDRDFEDLCLRNLDLERYPAAHRKEHSLEVQLPLLKALLPEVPVVPIAVPSEDRSLEFGRELGELLAREGGPEAGAIVASTDLTHYGADFYGFAPAGTGKTALEFAEGNDRAFLDRVADLDGAGVLSRARRDQSACGAGAVAAAVECVKVLGARGLELLEHTNSHRVEAGREGEAGNFVGYASALFV